MIAWSCGCFSSSDTGTFEPESHHEPRRTGTARDRGGPRSPRRASISRTSGLHWIHARGVTDFSRMTDLAGPSASSSRPRAPSRPRPSTRSQTSSDGTTKFLLAPRRRPAHRSRSTSPTPRRRRSACPRRSAAPWPARSVSPARWGWSATSRPAKSPGQARVLAARDGPGRHAVQHRADGHGRAAAQLRRDDEGAADPGGSDRASPSIPSASRCRRSGWCRPSKRLATEPLMPNLAISLHATTDDAAQRARAA